MLERLHQLIVLGNVGVEDHLASAPGHFQTHSEGHFQTQSTLESIFTARDIILGPKKPRVISKHT